MPLLIEHVWPELSVSWRSIVGTLTGFMGAALGSAGGVGGGSIFVPTANIILGFDTKSSTALSKCMIMGATLSTFGYNLRLKHPLERRSPLVDYDMAVLLQPMLLLGISVGVIFNTVFPTWMLTLVLICVLLGTSLRTCNKAVQIWKQETSQKREMQNCVNTLDVEAETRATLKIAVHDFGFSMVFRWVHHWCCMNVAIVHLLRGRTREQIPVAVLAFSAAARRIYMKNTRRDEEVLIERQKRETPSVTVWLLIMSGGGSLIAGVIAGLVGLGGGFALGPLLLEFGAHPQVLSATATFCMLFSSSMSVLEYYLVGRFPVPYALYLIAVSIIGGFSGQYVMDNLVKLFGRASIIVFLMTFLAMFCAVVLGGLGINDAIHQVKEGQYMGFLQICS